MIDKIYTRVEEGGYLPTRAHSDDAGIDLYTPESFTLNHGESRVVDLKVAFAIPKNYCGIIKSRSGLNIKCNLQIQDGVIDSSYRGNVMTRITNNGETYDFAKGDRICQMVIVPCLLCECVQVERLNDGETDRGTNGFGSTGA